MSFSQSLTIEFCPHLELGTSVDGQKCLRRRDGKNTLPGQPWVRLNGETRAYLQKAHLVTDLDRLSPYLALISTPSETNIDPLHHQEARGRRIIPTEHPGLHAIWYYDCAYIKPIPIYMFSKSFWEYIENTDPDLFMAACGFMRTYCFLIRYEIDFRRAIHPEINLIPFQDLENSHEPIDFDMFVAFISQFAVLLNQQVSPRYSYGSIRLSRLNYMAFLIGKLTYFHVHTQWRDYFTHLLAPIVATFAMISVLLNSMQVGLSTQSLHEGAASVPFVAASWWFSVFVLIATTAVLFAVVCLFIAIIVKDQYFAWAVLRATKTGKKVDRHAAV
ncbi:hypothetical protein E8E14_006487 [Neopestalotiopsis sp. 37M]|nr:hypothetical protein E8E14_006487 [Neopestalotiopsis sp. 37M]